MALLLSGQLRGPATKSSPDDWDPIQSAHTTMIPAGPRAQPAQDQPFAVRLSHAPDLAPLRGIAHATAISDPPWWPNLATRITRAGATIDHSFPEGTHPKFRVLCFPAPHHLHAPTPTNNATGTLADIAEDTPNSAMAMLLPPSHPPISVAGHPAPTTTDAWTRPHFPRDSLAFGNPGRVLVSRFNKDGSLLARVHQAANRHEPPNPHPDAALWTLPITERIARAVLVPRPPPTATPASQSWVAYVVADAIAAVDDTLAAPEPIRAVEIVPPSDAPHLECAHTRLVIPWMNTFDLGRAQHAFAGQRVALNPWFADSDRGYAFVRETGRGTLRPRVFITAGPPHTDNHADDRITLVIFSSITDEKLAEAMGHLRSIVRSAGDAPD